MLFGASTPFSKMLLDEINPFQLAGLMYLGAGLGLLPWLLLRKGTPPIPKPDGKNIRRILGMVVCGGLLGPVFLLFGLQAASASSVSLWLNFELFATALLGWLFFKDHLNLPVWLGVAIGILAGLLLSLPEGVSGMKGGLLVLVACVFWGLDNHFTALIDGITAVQSTIIKGIAAGSINFLLGIMLTGWNLGASCLIAMLVGFFAYGFSIVLYILSAQNLGATRSQVIFSSAPFFGLFFSVLLLHENITGIQFLSALLMAVSVTLIMIEKHVHLHVHHAFSHTHSHDHDDLHHTHRHPETDQESKHTHSHAHDETIHSHPHQPDIHHRHTHGNREVHRK